ncbi:hypothetical protein DFR49_1228 [Hephaestia caeni]|uniref:Uncharacterized protein n=1 Tax=Hephaestia caeni TaxID=645617 RepID=A0A397PAV4_9SPHN|nr:hypothetical protein [Hephaestia caeni]RIA46680.1 hypothetical protein DFR49_1228 [Hephaestia caeni]
MRSLGDPAFFRLFDALVVEANPQAGLKKPRWSIADTDWQWERHTFGGATHSFTMETCTVVRRPPKSWTLLVVKEFWWTADQRKPLRDLRWAKLVSGSRADTMRWLQARDRTRLAFGGASNISD